MLSRSQSARDGRLAFFLALGYLIWSLFPHAHFLVHAHANGEQAHSHFSVHDLKLRNQTLVAANPEVTSGAALERESGSEARGPGLKPLNLRHGHFTEDQNILAIGMARTANAQAVAPEATSNYPTLAPLRPYTGPTQARGPPSFSA